MNLDSRVRGTGPLWERRNVVAEGGVIQLVNDDTEESGGLFVRVLLELGLDIDNERRCYCRKKTGL